MNNLEVMGKLLDVYNLPRLNQEEIEYINRSTTNNKIESIKLPMNKSPDGLTGEFYQTFRE